ELELARRQLAFQVCHRLVHLQIEVLVDADLAGVQALERTAGCGRSCRRARRRFEVGLEVAVSPRRATRFDIRRGASWPVDSVDTHAALPAEVALWARKPVYRMLSIACL